MTCDGYLPGTDLQYLALPLPLRILDLNHVWNCNPQLNPTCKCLYSACGMLSVQLSEAQSKLAYLWHKPLLHHLFKVGMSRYYSASLFCVKRANTLWGGAPSSGVKTAAEVVTEPNWHLCKSENRPDRTSLDAAATRLCFQNAWVLWEISKLGSIILALLGSGSNRIKLA